VDTDGYQVLWNRNTKNYILAVGFGKSNAKISKRIVLGEELNVDAELTYGSINGALKIKLLEKIFFAPRLSYSRGKYKYRVTQPERKRFRFAKKDTPYSEVKDTDIHTDVMLGYSLKDDVDSYIYLSLTIDDDLHESEEHDDHTLKFGINYAINTKFIWGWSYAKDLSNNKEDSISNSSSSSFSVGYIF